ncbi:MAG: hypothetical protein DSZ01_03770 [Gammaproteobacteria bacterium]|nr:MAG: hypothetical protein DSZ01_03770 [Gammaproteobacteria bacterium]
MSIGQQADEHAVDEILLSDYPGADVLAKWFECLRCHAVVLLPSLKWMSIQSEMTLNPALFFGQVQGWPMSSQDHVI